MLGAAPRPCPHCDGGKGGGVVDRRAVRDGTGVSARGAVVDEAVRREAYDGLADRFDEEIEWHEFLTGIKLMRWWMMRRARGDVLEVAAGCAPHHHHLSRERLAPSSRFGRLPLTPPPLLPSPLSMMILPPLAPSGPDATSSITPRASLHSRRRIVPARWWTCASRRRAATSASPPTRRHAPTPPRRRLRDYPLPCRCASRTRRTRGSSLVRSTPSWTRSGCAASRTPSRRSGRWRACAGARRSWRTRTNDAPPRRAAAAAGAESSCSSTAGARRTRG